MNFEIYSKDNCGYCDMAISLAKHKGLPHTIKKLDKDFTREQLLEQFPTARSFPVVVLNGEFIGGFNEFKEKVKN